MTDLSSGDRSAGRSQLVGVCTEIARRGLAGPLSSGNASLRMGERLLVTPTAVALGAVAEQELVRVDANTGATAARTHATELAPTSELALHLAAHASAANDVRCVLHLHAPWMVAAACLQLDELPLLHYHQALLGECATPVVPYATPGSDELAQAVGKVLGPDVRAALMANHGAVVLASSAENALALAEVLEDICRLAVITRGGARELGRSELDGARRLFETYGARP